MGDLLRRSLERAPVVRFGEYQYFVHPLSDGLPAIEPTLLREVVDEMAAIADLGVDKIVTAEAMGIPIGTALSLKTGIPLTVFRKRKYGLPGEILAQQATGYSTTTLHVNGVERGERVLFVDDVVSTGGTLAAILQALTSNGITVKDIVVVFEKGEGRAEIEKRFGVRIKTLQRVEVRDGRAWAIP